MLVALTEATRIIDFGGSSAWVHEFCKSSLKNNTIKEYIVIEIDSVVNFMESLHIHNPPVIYKSTLDEIGSNFDIFYSNSAMQYLYDDIEFLKAIEKLQPHWILIEDFLSGDFDDFYTNQNYYEYKIPVKFRNQKKFIAGLSGYELVLSKPYAPSIHGLIRPYPMDNFPENSKLKYSQTILFEEKGCLK
jgi:putative methyltransferase (TIGR04325 family)